MNIHCSSTGTNENSFGRDRFAENGFREDPSVFQEKDTLHAGLRDQVESFYDTIDHDLNDENSGEVR